MPLSLEKLEYFSKLNGYIITRYFEKDNRLHSFEILSSETADCSIIYVPDKYNFGVSSSNDRVYTITNVQVSDDMRDSLEDYVQISNSDIRQSYSDLDIQSELPSSHKTSMSEHLDNTYKHTIILNDLKERDTILLKDMYRQLRRLKYCLHGIQHKIAIMNAPYMGFVDQENNILIYYIEKLKREKIRKMYVVIKLDIWFDKVTIINDEVNQIFSGIYSVLNTNQIQHTKNIKKMIYKNSNIGTDADNLTQFKLESQRYIEKFEDLLKKTNTIITSSQEEIDRIDAENTDDLNADMKRNHKKKQLKNKIRKVFGKKETILKHMVELKSTYENVSLSVDSILFDNIIMLDKILDNFKKLEKLTSNIT
jgi:hypothetical protein